jgi:hypothetical protein
MLTALDPGERGRARDQLRALLAAHETKSGVLLFDARTWIITARRRPGPGACRYNRTYVS